MTNNLLIAQITLSQNGGAETLQLHLGRPLDTMLEQPVGSNDYHSAFIALLDQARSIAGLTVGGEDTGYPVGFTFNPEPVSEEATESETAA